MDFLRQLLFYTGLSTLFAVLGAGFWVAFFAPETFNGAQAFFAFIWGAIGLFLVAISVND